MLGPAGKGRREGEAQKKGVTRTALLACSGTEVSSLYVFVPVVAPFSNASDMMVLIMDKGLSCFELYFVRVYGYPFRKGSGNWGCNRDAISNEAELRSRRDGLYTRSYASRGLLQINRRLKVSPSTLTHKHNAIVTTQGICHLSENACRSSL